MINSDMIKNLSEGIKEFGNVDYEKEMEKEMENEIRYTVKIWVKTLEILYDELQKSNLPDEIKKQILLNYGNKESK